MQSAYLAHPLNSDTHEGIERNRRNAAAWGAWILRTFGISVSADYLWISTQWDESPENRRLGLEADVEQIARQDFFFMVGGRVSTGMGIELDSARELCKPVLDLTAFGYEAPTGAAYALEQHIRQWLREREMAA